MVNLNVLLFHYDNNYFFLLNTIENYKTTYNRCIFDILFKILLVINSAELLQRL